MRLRTALGIWFIGIGIFYAAGLMGSPLMLLLSFELVLFVTIYLFLAVLLWKLLALDMKASYEHRKVRYNAVLLACLLSSALAGLAINNYLLPEKLHPASLIGNAGILFFTVFLVWNLIRPGRKHYLLPGFGFFIVLIAFMTAFGAIRSTKEESKSHETLKSLPYANWVPAKNTLEKSGVVKHDKGSSFEGINIYCPRDLAKAYLIGMAGNTLHGWTGEFGDEEGWQHVELCKNGDLLVIVKDRMVFRLGWDSDFKWARHMRSHHDIAVAEEGDIHVLARKDEVVFLFGLPVPVLNDYIVTLSEDGTIKKEFSLFEVYRKQLPVYAAIRIYRWLMNPDNVWEAIKLKAKYDFVFTFGTPLDIFHHNTIEIMDRTIEGLGNKGDLLLSALNLDLVGVLDFGKGQLSWSWGPGDLSKQHHPTLLDNGNILIFDNGVEKKRSRIVEIEPLTKEIVWEYKANPPEDFFSLSRGSSQRLPNGNTLITESDNGHVFEITGSGEIVWEFYNPEINKETRERAAIYRMMRITDGEQIARLRGLH